MGQGLRSMGWGLVSVLLLTMAPGNAQDEGLEYETELFRMTFGPAWSPMDSMPGMFMHMNGLGGFAMVGAGEVGSDPDPGLQNAEEFLQGSITFKDSGWAELGDRPVKWMLLQLDSSAILDSLVSERGAEFGVASLRNRELKVFSFRGGNYLFTAMAMPMLTFSPAMIPYEGVEEAIAGFEWKIDVSGSPIVSSGRHFSWMLADGRMWIEAGSSRATPTLELVDARGRFRGDVTPVRMDASWNFILPDDTPGLWAVIHYDAVRHVIPLGH